MSSGLRDTVAELEFGPGAHFVCHQNTVSMCLSYNEQGVQRKGPQLRLQGSRQQH